MQDNFRNWRCEMFRVWRMASSKRCYLGAKKDWPQMKTVLPRFVAAFASALSTGIV